MQLYPHLLLRTDAATSPAATILRCAGYVVTKVRRDEDLDRLVAALHVDAIVAELPMTQAAALARRAGRFEVPLLFLTNAPDSLRKFGGCSAATLHPRDADNELVSAVDLLIARRAARKEIVDDAGRYRAHLAVV